MGFRNGFWKKAVAVGKLRNKNKKQRRRLSLNFNFLGFGEEEEEHEFEPIGAVIVKEFTSKA